VIIFPLQVNFSELFRCTGGERTPLKNGVHLEEFTLTRKNAAAAPRRRLNRMYGGEITTPFPHTNAAIRETLQVKIMNEEYCLREIITP